MITLCLCLLFLGIMCLIAEMFIPGFGVCGISGIVLMIIAAVLAVFYVPYGWLFVSAETVLLAATVYTMFNYIKKKQLHGKLIMDETLNEDVPQIGDLNYFVGKEGVTKTPLRPFGEVDFNGVSIEVSSNGAYVEQGKPVKVTEVQKNKIIVTEQKQHN